MGKLAVITGGANGLGKALAQTLVKRGYALAIIDIDLPGLEGLKSELSNVPQRITIHPTDISKQPEVEAAHKEIMQAHQRVDMLINNAGISISRRLEELDLEDYRRLMDINFWGTVHCSKIFLADLKRSKDGRVVNIISNFALVGFPGKTGYSSSKSAVMGFTHALHTELRNSAVKVCMVIPPALDTGLVRNSLHFNDASRAKEVAFVKKNSMPVDKAAQKIIRQVEKGKFRTVIGSKMYWIDLMARLFPTRVHALIGKNKNRFDFL